MGMILVFNNSCKKEDKQVPVLTTSEVSNINQTFATGGGNISSDGGSTINARGACWSKEHEPTTTDQKSSSEGTALGVFTNIITGLSVNTTYYVRAYATNDIGTGYGNEVTFKTLTGVVDIDGNEYATVTIGTQVWMAENLRVTKYRNGDEIGTTTPSTLNISNETDPKYQWPYEGYETNSYFYGRLYTWYVVKDSRNVAPVGWHVPSVEEWFTLIDYLGGYQIAGEKMKETGTNFWESPNEYATNESGFTALPGGMRGSSGKFQDMRYYCYFWSISEGISSWDSSLCPIAIELDLGHPMAYKNYNIFNDGNSIRCVKD